MKTTDIDFGQVQKLEVCHLNAFPFLYLECTGEAQLPSTFERLVQTSGMQDLPLHAEKPLLFYLDSFRDTPPELVRFRPALRLTSEASPAAPLLVDTVEAGSYWFGRFDVSLAKLGFAWMHLFKEMANAGLRKAEGPVFEQYLSDFSTLGNGVGTVELYVPIQEFEEVYWIYGIR